MHQVRICGVLRLATLLCVGAGFSLACDGARQADITAPSLDTAVAGEAAPVPFKSEAFAGIEAPLPPPVCALFPGFSTDPLGACSNQMLEPVGPGRWRARGRTALFMDITSDPRTTGLSTVQVLANFDASFSGPASGSFSLTVGEWSALGFVPEAGAGAWEGRWHGSFSADGSFAYEASGRGSGGSVDGLQVRIDAHFTPSNPPQPVQLSGYVFDPQGH